MASVSLVLKIEAMLATSGFTEIRVAPTDGS
jgi:hypothetical protein